MGQSKQPKEDPSVEYLPEEHLVHAEVVPGRKGSKEDVPALQFRHPKPSFKEYLPTKQGTHRLWPRFE